MARRTIRDLGKVYPNAQLWPLSMADLTVEGKELQKYARTYPKGRGYWRWKPAAVNLVLQHAAFNDIVIYVDGRCGIPTCKIGWVDDIVGNRGIDCAAWPMEGMEERVWTTADLLNHFGYTVDSPEAKSDQFAATFFGLRKNTRTLELIDKWRSTVDDFAHLCRDIPSVTPNHTDFRENRYDQSAFSLTLKRQLNSGLTIRNIRSEEVTAVCSIVPHAKTHPRVIPVPPKAVRLAKTFFRVS